MLSGPLPLPSRMTPPPVATAISLRVPSPLKGPTNRAPIDWCGPKGRLSDPPSHRCGGGGQTDGSLTDGRLPRYPFILSSAGGGGMPSFLSYGVHPPPFLSPELPEGGDALPARDFLKAEGTPPGGPTQPALTSYRRRLDPPPQGVVKKGPATSPSNRAPGSWPRLGSQIPHPG